MSERPADVSERAWEEAQGYRSMLALTPANREGVVALVARVIDAEREKLATAILAKRYTEDQGIDAEMEAYNGGLEDAAKLLRGAS